MRSFLALGVAALGLLVVMAARIANALPGTHAPAVSTYDARASSIVLAYRHGFSDGGTFNTVSYNANFTSTSGILSAQFGLHYINFAETGFEGAQQGIGGSGVAMLNLPLAERYEDGMPRAALAPYFGGAPTGYFSGQRNTLTIPFVLGFGVPLSPARVVTFTPWYELALSANLDSAFKPIELTITAADFDGRQVSLDADRVREIVNDGVELEFSFVVPMRTGLDIALHLGESVDLNAYGMLSTLGGGFQGALVTTLGFAFVVRWDNIVPAILPPERRLEREDCGAIEERFRTCPNSRGWTPPGSPPIPSAAPVPPPPTAAPPSAAPPSPPPPRNTEVQPPSAPADPNSPTKPPSAVFPP